MNRCDTGFFAALFADWQLIGLVAAALFVTIALAHSTGLNKPWPFSMVLSAGLTFSLLPLIPCVSGLSAYLISIAIWAFLFIISFCPTLDIQRFRMHRTIWDYFEEVDSDIPPTHKGVSL